MDSDCVTIVTRTKDRPLLISRSIESVLNQTYQNWQHIIVNDGGEEKALQNILNKYSDRYSGRLKVIHNKDSIGAVPALNLGMQSATSEYVVTHDDDDGWENSFLDKSIAALKERKRLIPNTRGIICHTTEVTEHISGKTVIEEYRYSLNGWVREVALPHLAATNFITPISFLFERVVFSELGFFKNLKFCDDWEFYLRFLSRYEIAVLPEHLANYHVRRKATDAYGNTVAVGIDEHRAVVTELRNDLVRQDLNSGKFGLGYLLALSMRMPITGNLRHRFWIMRNRTLARWRPSVIYRRFFSR